MPDHFARPNATADAALPVLLELEHAGWQSLCESTAASFYGDLMTEGALMILGDGSVMRRIDVVESLAGAPAWDSYEIEDASAVTLDGAIAVVYTGTGRRAAVAFRARMTSVYVHHDDGWRLALHQQTPVPPAGDGDPSGS